MNDGPLFGHFNLGTKFSSVFDFLDVNHDVVDVALMKYCFNDMDWQFSTGQEAFDHYKPELDAYRAVHPETTFIHFTMPLRNSEDILESERSKYRDLIL